jgi:predicted Fe-Mo cluster-binding NifX family protein
MKVAVTSQGPDIASEVDPRFGRAKFLILVDTETGESTAHDNTQNLNAAQGAGIQAAQNVVRLGVDAVITGNVGPKAFAALQAGNVKPYIGATGSVSDAVEQFKDGGLQCADEANVEGHWT